MKTFRQPSDFASEHLGRAGSSVRPLAGFRLLQEVLQIIPGQRLKEHARLVVLK